MEESLALRLAALPRLAFASKRVAWLNCKICRGQAEFFDVTDFWKGSEFFRFGPSGISVQYFRCRVCGFMWAPMFDAWSPEEFACHIYNDEYALVDNEYLEARPKRTASHIANLLRGFEDTRILDYGSGSGLFARHLGDAGFRRVASFDPFSAPGRPIGKFEIITCFEVIEHSPAPGQMMDDLVSFLDADGCILIGESLQPPDITTLRCSWWYCMPRNGHISLFTDRALATLAMQRHLLFHPASGLHAFSRFATDKFGSLARRISEPILPICLEAPAAGDSQVNQAIWHGVERFSGAATRWSASESLMWTVAVPPNTPLAAQIRVPFTAEIRPGFAGKSRIVVNSAEAQTSVVDGALVALVRIEEPGDIEIAVQTPPLASPSQLRGAPDRRQLGLAVQCRTDG
jgi:hypothetical protein